ncbi:MAG TPA: hypothetical protein VGO67_21445 [Verrucomicrobiae bacterium]|jgi:hypothetical protein
MRQVESQRRRVRQGIQVEDAQDFARYLSMSGILDLMGENQELNPQLQKLFPYSSNELRQVVNLLYNECCEYWRGKTRDSEGTAKGADRHDLESISLKLDKLAGGFVQVQTAVAQLQKPRPIRATKPRLRVLKPVKGVA